MTPVHHYDNQEKNQAFTFDHYQTVEPVVAPIVAPPVVYDTPAHTSYDAYGHDYDTEHSEHIAYRHHSAKDIFHDEY